MKLSLKKISLICLFCTSLTHGQEKIQINGRKVDINPDYELSCCTINTPTANTLLSIEGKDIKIATSQDPTLVPKAIDIYNSLYAQLENFYTIDTPSTIKIEAGATYLARSVYLKTDKKVVILGGEAIDSSDTIVEAQSKVVLRSPHLEVSNFFVTAPTYVELKAPSDSPHWLKGIKLHPAENVNRPFTYFLQGTLNFNPPSTPSWFIIIGANKLSFIIDNLALDPARKEDTAARTLQAAFRNYFFKKNQQRIYGEMYQQGLLYRDGKIEGFEKDSFLANAYAGANFYPLARQGDVKAQHNLAMIQYKVRNYISALKWFEKASQQGFEPSTRNLEKLRTEISKLELPFEMWLHISTYFDDRTLLAFRAANRSTANVIETLIKQQSGIKTPLFCLTSQEKSHPFPHTISYFIRKKYRKLGIQESSAEMYERYLKCADFCKEWNFVGETLFRSLGNPALYNDKEQIKFILKEFRKHLLTQKDDNSDIREMNFWLSVIPLITDTENYVDQITFFNCVFNCLTVASKLPPLEKRDIGRFYVSLAGDRLMGRNLIEFAKLCYAFSADQKDPIAQNNLGVIWEKEGNIEEARKLYSMAVEHDYPLAQINLGFLLMKEGNLSYSKHLFHKAAEKEHTLAFYNLGVIYTLEKDISTGKKYLKKAADKNFPSAHFNLARLYEDEGDIEQAEYRYQIAADLGVADAQCNYAIYLHREGKIEESKKYFEMAATQGDQIAMLNLIRLFEKDL
jgi:TPR repeat protein